MQCKITQAVYQKSLKLLDEMWTRESLTTVKVWGRWFTPSVFES